MDKELIEHIVSQLKQHQEPYPAHAWERFSSRKNSKQKVLWPYWWAAACILLAVVGLFWYNPKSPKNTIAKIEQPKKATKEPIIKHDRQLHTLPDKAWENTGQSSGYRQKTITNGQKIHIFETPNPIRANIEHTQTDTINMALNITNAVVKEYKQNIDDQTVGFYDKTPKLQANEQKIQQKKAFSKWEPEVYIAPAIGNDNKVNLNYGVSLSFNLNRKFALSSGVAYGTLSGQTNMNVAGIQTLYTKNLESVNTSFTGISMPLEVKYKIADQVYAGIGVSALAVISTAQKSTYVSNEPMRASSLNAFGEIENQTVIVKAHQSQSEPSNAVSVNDYFGFYHFSLGYKQKISPKNHVTLEPFVRLPMNTRTNLNLTNGGLRIKFNF